MRSCFFCGGDDACASPSAVLCRFAWCVDMLENMDQKSTKHRFPRRLVLHVLRVRTRRRVYIPASRLLAGLPVTTWTRSNASATSTPTMGKSPATTSYRGGRRRLPWTGAWRCRARASGAGSGWAGPRWAATGAGRRCGFGSRTSRFACTGVRTWCMWATFWWWCLGVVGLEVWLFDGVRRVSR